MSYSLCKKIKREFTTELQYKQIQTIKVVSGISIITVIGRGMKQNYGIAGELFSLLGQYQINIMAISQGSTELSISFVVERNEEVRAMKVLHTLLL